jgi:hypothetical protein
VIDLRGRKGELFWQHPAEWPDDFTGTHQYLIHPPDKLSSTAAWIRSRDNTLLSMIDDHPDDPDLPNYLRCVEAILAWRAEVALEDRFWRADPEVGFGNLSSGRVTLRPPAPLRTVLESLPSHGSSLS